MQADSIKIWFMDGSYKSFPYSREEKMEDLWFRIIQKLSLSNEGAECFFLWASCDTLGSIPASHIPSLKQMLEANGCDIK